MDTSNNERSRDWLCAAAAAGAGLLAGMVDFHNDEPQAAVAVLLVLCGLMGFARPARAWRWGIIAPLGIPAVYLAGRAMGFKPVYWPQPNIFATLLALIPGLIGVYGGVIARRILSKANG